MSRRGSWLYDVFMSRGSWLYIAPTVRLWTVTGHVTYVYVVSLLEHVCACTIVRSTSLDHPWNAVYFTLLCIYYASSVLCIHCAVVFSVRFSTAVTLPTLVYAQTMISIFYAVHAWMVVKFAKKIIIFFYWNMGLVCMQLFAFSCSARSIIRFVVDKLRGNFCAEIWSSKVKKLCLPTTLIAIYFLDSSPDIAC